MTLKELKLLCKGGEGQYVEFKQNANQPNQIVEEVVGFANSTGGNLLVGIDDNGNPGGLKFAEDDATYLTHYINNNVHPRPLFSYQLITISKSRLVIHYKIKSGDAKPYGVKKGDSRKVFYRVDDLCIQASRELKSILRSASLDRGQTIKYTELENQILKLIPPEARLTKTKLSENVNFSSRKISDCLVRLVSAGVLNIIPAIGDDLYEYHDQS